MPVDLKTVFRELKAIYRAYESACVILHDLPGKYYLGTYEVRAKDGYRTWFGGAEIKKNYVSAHLIPVYAHPDLLDGISDELKKRMQGKSCFNFKVVDPKLFAELKQLADAGFRRFKADGRV
jgi:hypothetical protein